MSSSSAEGNLKDLRDICKDKHSGSDSLLDHYIQDLFPLLDMRLWIEHALEMIPEGRVTTFGSIAKGLGTINASRTVGAICSKMGSCRVVYSDGSIPEPSLCGIREGITTIERNGREVVEEANIFRDISFDDPPFVSLTIDQDHLRKSLIRGKETIEDTAGIDISSGKGSHYCAICSFDRDGNPNGDLCVKGNVGIPYVSGFLFYREGPLILPTIERAQEENMISDTSLLVIDGNGRMHPRRMGLACQIGASTDMMTCGIAKKLMFGRICEYYSAGMSDDLAPVMDSGEIIGYASRRNRGSPIFISEGHRTDLDDVTDILLGLRRSRLPEPIRMAHNTANRVRRSETPSGDL